MKDHRRRSLLILGLATIPSLLSPSASAAADRGWLARALVGWNGVSGPTELLVGGGATRVRFGPTDEISYGIELERRLTPRLGVELGMLYSRPQIERRIDSGGVEGVPLFAEATFRPITAGLDIHLAPRRRIDLTLTPLAGYALYDDLSFRFEDGQIDTLEIGADFVWGVRAAADIPLGRSRWGVSLGARFLEASMRTEFDGLPLAIALDPVILTVGLSRRWPRSSPTTGDAPNRLPAVAPNFAEAQSRPPVPGEGKLTTLVSVAVFGPEGTPYRAEATVELLAGSARIRLQQSPDSLPYEGRIPAGSYELQVVAGDLSSPVRRLEVAGTEKLLSAFLGARDWPFYRLNGNGIPFSPREDLLAVVFTTGPPDLRSAADLVGKLSAQLPLELLDPDSLAGRSIWLFRITRPIALERLRGLIALLLGGDVRVGTVVDSEPGRVTVLDNRFVVRFRDDLPPQELEALVASAGGRTLRSFMQAGNARLVEFLQGDHNEHLRIVEGWSERGLLVYGEPDLLVEIVDAASLANPASASEPQLNLPLQNVDLAWQHLADLDPDLELGSSEVYVATLDRGLQTDHPDLAGDLTDGTPQLARCFDFKSLIDCTDPGYAPDNDHGMQVFGIISARANNGIAVDGIAPNAHHIALKRHDFYNSRYLDVLLWAAGFQIDDPPASWPAQPSRPGADIISLSHRIYLPEPPGLMDDTFRYLTSHGRGGRGTLLVYAAGNESSSIATNYPFPAHPHTMAISNSRPPDATGLERLDPTSNFGPQIDLCARGAGVVSLNADGGTRSFGNNATSAAAPTVAAAAALMLSAEPELTWIELRDILRETAVRIDLDRGGWTADGTSELYGFGRLDVGAAVEAAVSDR